MQLNSRVLGFFNGNKAGLLYLVLGLVVFVLCVQYSQDWIRYEFYNADNTKKMVHIGWPELLNPTREPIFQLVSVHLSRYLSFPGFVLLATVSLLCLKLGYLEKILGGSLAGVFFYICVYLLLFEGTAIRLAYATALVIPALYCIRNHQWRNAILLILLASQIHFSTILFLLVIPVYFVKRSDIYVYLLLAISVLVVVLDLSAFNMIRELAGLINPRYLQYDDSAIKLRGQNSTGLYFYFIAFYGGLLLVIKHYLKNRLSSDRFSRMVYLNCVVAIALMCFFHSHIAVGARLGELMLLPVVILLAWLHDYFVNTGMRLHRFVLVATFCAYFLARFVYLYPTAFRA